MLCEMHWAFTPLSACPIVITSHVDGRPLVWDGATHTTKRRDDPRGRERTASEGRANGGRYGEKLVS